ncbi:MAG TPA: hypothetical protein ENJ97_06415, partial [Planctomycetes bacterium]|nr:hypothetical protein [Planctomycetota bacterium]
MNRGKILLGAGAVILVGLAWFLLRPGEGSSLPPLEGGPRRGKGPGAPSSLPAPSPLGGDRTAAGRKPVAPPSERKPLSPASSVPPSLEGRVVESGGRGIPGVRVLLLKAAKGKGRDPLERARDYAARAGEVRRKLARVGPSLPPERAKSYMKAFLARLDLQVAAQTRSGKEGRFRFGQVVLPPEEKEVLVLETEAPKGFLPSDPVQVEPSFLEPGKGPELVLLRPASVKGMILAWPGGGKAGRVLAWRLGPGKALEERNRFLFQSLDFELKGLHPGKWRLALLSQWGKSSFSWGPLLDLREGERKDGIVLKGDAPSSLE